MNVRRLLFLITIPLTLAACDSSLPSIEGRTIPASDPRVVALTEDDLAKLSGEDTFSRTGGPDDPSLSSMRPVDLSSSSEIPFLELYDVSIRDLSKLLVVDHAGLALAISGDLSARVDWSGGPFPVGDALAALEEIAVSNSLSFRRIGDVISISSGEGSKAVSVGYTRVYRSSAQAITEALSQLFTRVKTAAVGRTVSVSGSSADIAHSLNLIRSLDRDSVSSLPWSVVRVSPSVADQAVEIASSLADPADPLA